MHTIRSLLAAALCSALVACGGGSGTDATGPSDTAAGALATGTVTGFGSVIVDGQRYDDSVAKVFVETDPSQAVEGVLTRVRLGMQVEVEAASGGDGDSARTIRIDATVVGRIASATPTTIVVAGQTIVASTDPLAPTFFEGANGIGDLAVGDRVEVHGQRDATGVIVASRIERKDPRSAELTRVVGVISGLDPTARTFAIGGLVVAYGDATRVVPAATAIGEGRIVAVYTTRPLVGNRLDAEAIKVRRREVEVGRQLRIGGRIRMVDAAAPSFMLDGLLVDASAASFPFGNRGDLLTGVWVRVVGEFADGVVRARTVKLRKREDTDLAVSLYGTVRDFVSSADFKVRGVPIDASATDVRFVGGAAPDLADGRLVRIAGDVRGDKVLATSVVFVDAAPASTGVVVERVRLGGIVSTLDGTTRRFGIAATAVRFDDATVFVGGAQNLRTGANVEVEGRVVGGELVAARIEIEDPNGDQGAAVRGTIGAFVSVSDFRVLGQRVDASTAAFDGGTAQDLRLGVEVDVRGTLADGVLHARQVSFRR